MIRPQDQFIHVQGFKVRYWTMGTAGSVVVLIHGISCSVAEWAHNIEALSREHTVYALDLLGHGLSDKPIDWAYSGEASAQFVLDFMSALGTGQAHLVGNSMGGLVALEAAALAPQRVLSLTLAAPAGLGKKTLLNFRLASLPVIGEWLARPNLASMTLVWRMAFVDKSHVTPAIIADKVALAKLPGATAVFLKILRTGISFNGFLPGPMAVLHDKVRQIKTPAFAIWGKQDVFLPVEQLGVLSSLMPQTETWVIDACGHVPMIEHASAFNQRVLAFIHATENRATI